MLRAGLAIALGAGASGPLLAQAAEDPRQEGPVLAAEGSGGYETLARLGIGSGPGEAGVERSPGGPAWGPASFDIAADGSIYVLDGVNRTVHVLTGDGGYARGIPFPDGVTCPEDIDVTRDGICLLDLAAQPPAVELLDGDGHLARSWSVPAALADDGISGVNAREATGTLTVSLEIDNAWEVPFVAAGRQVNARVPKQRHGDIVDVPACERADFAISGDHGVRSFSVEMDWEGGRAATLTAHRSGTGPVRARLESHGTLASVVPLGEDDAGRAYVLAEEIDGARVRACVKAFDASGGPATVSQLPLTEYETHPRRAIRVTAEGDVLALVTGAEAVSVVRLEQRAERGPGLGRAHHGCEEGSSAGSTSGSGVAGRIGQTLRRLFGPASAYAAWTRLDAYERAMQYCENSWYCTVYNYYPNGVNIRPRYITSYNRNWMSVPYCWGGWDLSSTFNSLMSSRYDAGDINTKTGGKQPSTAGVDCSGLVSRLWGLGTKRNTSTVPGIGLGATDVSYYLGLPGSAGERMGDLYLDPGSHAMFVDYRTSGGTRVFESTKFNSYDRVVHIIRADSDLVGYYVRRYVNWWM